MVDNTNPMTITREALFRSLFVETNRRKIIPKIPKNPKVKTTPQNPGISIPGNDSNVIVSLLMNKVMILKNTTTNKMGIK